jgi:cobalt-zinc-cadmium efflux system protein
VPHDHSHSHGPTQAHEGNARRLQWAVLLTGGFMMVEVVAGLLLNSIALLADAAHMFTDTLALVLALVAFRLARQPSDARRTYGYHRYEILAAAFNALLLLMVAGYILFEAWQRALAPQPVRSGGMLAVAAIGLTVNLVCMRLLAEGAKHQLNVKGAYLEVWSDALASVGVIVGAALIAVTDWVWIDTAIAVAIAAMVVPRTWTMLTESIHILLQGAPKELDLAALEQAIRAVPGVRDVHDLHVWVLTSGKNSLTAHVVHEPQVIADQLLARLTELLAHRFELIHTTVQLELEPCAQAGVACRYQHEPHAEHHH